MGANYLILAPPVVVEVKAPEIFTWPGENP
jgi:hypothetical protein